MSCKEKLKAEATSWICNSSWNRQLVAIMDVTMKDQTTTVYWYKDTFNLDCQRSSTALIFTDGSNVRLLTFS